MEWKDIAIYALGFFAQGLFAARTLIQWILSEKANRVTSPTIFWQLSLFGSLLFMVYGWLRGDFVIILGQVITYYIYIWNLNIKESWQQLHKIARYTIILLPLLGISYALLDLNSTVERLFGDDTVSWLLLFGSIGQLIFTFRFVYQWLYSRRHGESLLPATFWVLSIIGAGITFIYGIYRFDWVLILGQGGSVIVFARNLWIDYKYRREETKGEMV